MAQIITEEAVILYDPIETVFEVEPIGGSPVQRQNTITGEYAPDRTLTPMVLSPSLQVIDPNVQGGARGSDRTASITVQWYRVTTSGNTETETEIVAAYSAGATAHADYELYGKGLMVNANTPAGSSVHLRLKASYVNPNTNEPLRFRHDFLLTTEPFIEFNPAIEVNVPNYSVVDPFRLTAANRQLAVVARFFAGQLDISTSQNVVFLWEKLDGTAYRSIAATDVEVVSITGNTMVLDQECIGRCKYRVTAWHSGYAAQEHRRSYTFTLNRQMSGATLQARIVRGKFLKADVRESEAEMVLSVNSSEVANPEDFFRAKWSIYRQSGSSQQGRTLLGWGNRAVANRSLTGSDKTKVPTFEMEAHSLSEYQIATDDNGTPVTDDNGNYIIGQVIED